MTRSRGMDALVTDGVLLAHEAQLQLADRHGDHDRWDVDLAAGEFRFTGEQPATYPVQFLGSAAPGPRSWLWAWANPTQFGAGVLGAAEATLAFGRDHDVPELTTAEVSFDDHPTDAEPEPGYDLGWCLSIAARLASGSWFGYSGEVGGGTRAWMLLGGMRFSAPDVVRTTRVLGEGFAATTVSDHRRAVTSWATLRQVPFDGRQLVLPDGVVTVTFDELDRLTAVEGTAGGS